MFSKGFILFAAVISSASAFGLHARDAVVKNPVNNTITSSIIPASCESICSIVDTLDADCISSSANATACCSPSNAGRLNGCLDCLAQNNVQNFGKDFGQGFYEAYQTDCKTAGVKVANTTISGAGKTMRISAGAFTVAGVVFAGLL